MNIFSKKSRGIVHNTKCSIIITVYLGCRCLSSVVRRNFKFSSLSTVCFFSMSEMSLTVKFLPIALYTSVDNKMMFWYNFLFCIIVIGKSILHHSVCACFGLFLFIYKCILYSFDNSNFSYSSTSAFVKVVIHFFDYMALFPPLPPNTFIVFM